MRHVDGRLSDRARRTKRNALWDFVSGVQAMSDPATLAEFAAYRGRPLTFVQVAPGPWDAARDPNQREHAEFFAWWRQRLDLLLSEDGTVN